MDITKPQPPIPGPRRTGSHSNLTHLTLAPLSTASPFVGPEPQLHPHSTSQSALVSPEIFSTQKRTSYIAGKSAPTTPGILSRSPSRERISSATGHPGSKSYTHIAFPDDGLTRCGSSTVLLRTEDFHRRKKKRASASKSSDGGEWLFRAGTAISSEARESKGQSWLVSRESSTSLVGQEEGEGVYAVPRGGGEAAGKGPVASRASSARSSRHGSRVGSRADLAGLSMSALGRGRRGTEDYFVAGRGARDAVAVMGPDFVDEEVDEEEEDDEDDEEEERLEEAEVARLASERGGFGFGGVVDRVMGWTLFDLKGGMDGEEEDQFRGGGRERQEQRATASKGENEKISTTLAGSGTATEGRGSDGGDKSSGWKDAAWLLSVASKIVF